MLKLKHFKLQLWLIVVFAGLCIWTQNTDAANGLRSAYLGPSVWREDLSSSQINDQLKDHFAEVLVQLEAKNASSLLTALTRAEASAIKPWSKDERRTALINLAHNRQLQIKRIRDYMNRGRFPLNEGQSPDAAPIFVDSHGTHCAVGYLMYVDGKDSEVTHVVEADNLVRILDVHGGNMLQWIRSSGLTQEEAAMIQPSYPVNLFTFDEFASGNLSLPLGLSSEITLLDISARGTRFTATLPASFAADPDAIDAIFAQGLVELDNNNVLGPAFNTSRGIISGPSGTRLGGPDYIGGPYDPPIINSQFTPSNLDTWLYIGDSDFNGLVGGANATGNVGIIEIDYQIRSGEGSNFSRIAVTSTSNSVGSGEQNAVLCLSKIYRGDSNDLLGESQVFGVGSTTSSTGTDITSLSEDFLRIKTYGLVVRSGSVNRIFNEFETVTVPEPVKGDVDMSGIVDFRDIAPFILVLQAGAFQVEADCNCDGTVNFEDIAPFIGLLQGQ